MVTEVYGHSDDLVEFDGDISDEVGAYEGISLLFSDGTCLRLHYTFDGIWKIDVKERGKLFERLEECNDPDAARYSDTAHFRDGLEWFIDARVVQEARHFAERRGAPISAELAARAVRLLYRMMSNGITLGDDEDRAVAAAMIAYEMHTFCSEMVAGSASRQA